MTKHKVSAEESRQKGRSWKLYNRIVQEIIEGVMTFLEVEGAEEQIDRTDPQTINSSFPIVSCSSNTCLG